MSRFERASAFKNWFCKNHFQSAAQANSASAEIGIPIDDVPVKLGMASSGRNFVEWRDSYCQENAGSDSSLEATASFAATVNPALVAVIDACLKRPGLHVSVEEGANPRIFRFMVLYRKFSKEDPPRVKSFLTSASPPLACQQQFKEGDVISDPLTVICTRTSDDALELAFNAIDAPQGVLFDTPMSLPAIPPPAPPPDLVRMDACRQTFSASRDLAQVADLYSEGMKAYLDSRQREEAELRARFPGTDDSMNEGQYIDNKNRADKVKRENDDAVAPRVAAAEHLKDYVTRLKLACDSPATKVAVVAGGFSVQDCQRAVDTVLTAMESLYRSAAGIKWLIGKQEAKRMSEWLDQERPNDPSWKIGQYSAAKDKYTAAQATMDVRVNQMNADGDALMAGLEQVAPRCHL